MLHCETRFNTIRTLSGNGLILPHFVVEDILKVYPVNIECEAFENIVERHGEWFGSVEVVDFTGFAAIVALTMYQVSGDPREKRKVAALTRESAAQRI